MLWWKTAGIDSGERGAHSEHRVCGIILFPARISSACYFKESVLPFELTFAIFQSQLYLIMAVPNARRQRIQALVLADSRGSYLWRELRRTHNDDVYFRVISRKGASLRKLWEIAEAEIFQGRPDIIILYGGICDLTDRSYNWYGRREFWPPADLVARINEVANLMSSIANNLTLMNISVRLCFLPEAGCDLLSYNRCVDPIPRELMVLQENFEHGLKYLQKHARILNSQLGMPTPWTLDATHGRRYGKLVPVYNRLHDGLHPTLEVTRELANILSKYLSYVIHEHGL